MKTAPEIVENKDHKFETSPSKWTPPPLDLVRGISLQFLVTGIFRIMCLFQGSNYFQTRATEKIEFQSGPKWSIMVKHQQGRSEIIVFFFWC